MTDLTLEELTELEQILGPSLRLTAACSMARELLSLRAAQQSAESAAGGWIAATARLPEPNVYVLAWEPSVGYVLSELADFAEEPTVTHWRPLPAAPGEGTGT
jgi:hypothetical protein